MNDPADWDALGDQAEERGERAEHYRCHLTAWVLRLLDERWHGEEERECTSCDNASGQYGSMDWHGVIRWHPCRVCIGGKVVVPTFGLLLDHSGTEPCKCVLKGKAWGYLPGKKWRQASQTAHDAGQPGYYEDHELCHGSGKALVRGHVGEFADWLRHVWGQVGLADKVEELRLIRPHGGGWCLMDVSGGIQSYPDAARELIRRVVAAVTEECECEGGSVDSGGITPWGASITVECPNCSGLGWRAVELKEGGRCDT